MLRNQFFFFIQKNTPINGDLECGRIFTKVLNPLSFEFKKRGTVGGRISNFNITLDMLMYNRINWRDEYNKKPKNYSYDRNPESTAYIPKGEGTYYICGGINGGKTEAYLQLVKELKKNINIDLDKNVIASYHLNLRFWFGKKAGILMQML